MSDSIKSIITKDQANKAFSMLVEAINAAMAGKFPVGLDHIEMHMQIKGALHVLGAALKEHYEAEQPKSPPLKAVPPASEAAPAPAPEVKKDE